MVRTALDRFAFVGLLLSVSLTASVSTAIARPPFRVGMIFDGPNDRNDEIRQIFEKEILGLLGSEFPLRFPEDKRWVADWTARGVQEAAAAAEADRNVDLVLGFGVMASHQLCTRTPSRKLVICPYVIDPEIQGIPMVNGTSGTPRMTYVTTPSRIERDIRIFQDLAHFHRMTLMTTQGLERTRNILQKNTDALAKKIDLQVSLLTVDTSAQEALAQLPADTEAVFIAPLLRLSKAEFQTLIDELNHKRLPTFSLLGQSEVEKGVLASAGKGIDHQRIARRVAINLQRILLGESAAKVNVIVEGDESLVLNMETAQTIGFSPSWTILTEAVLLNPTGTSGRRQISLEQAAEEALLANLELKVNEQEVLASQETIPQNRAALLPRIDANVRGNMIDADRAQASLGATPERQATVGGTASQQLYVDRLYANLTVAKFLQESQEYQRARLKLDIIQEAATAYLDVLRAKTFERIQRNNLTLTRSNLELAKVRRAVGVAGPSEEFRWESQIAQDRAQVIRATANLRAAEIALNRVINRPLEEEFETANDELETERLLANQRQLAPYIDNPQAFKTYRGFMVREGLLAAPELQAIGAVIQGAERNETAAVRSFWLPEFNLGAEVNHQFAEGGAGATPGLVIPGIPEGTFPTIARTRWSMGVQAELPILSGFGRFADLAQAEYEVSRSNYEKFALAQRIEEQIRTAIHLAGASYANIELSRDSAEAAHKNLNVVRESYARGAIDYIALLDAQNQALTADQSAANAVYDFLVDQTTVQRTVSRFDFMETNESNADRLQRLERFYQVRGVAPSTRTSTAVAPLYRPAGP